MALSDKQRAAHWQDNSLPPTPVQHTTPVKIDLTNTGVEYQDGKIVAITGSLAVVPHAPTQHGPLSSFFKDGPVICVLEENHNGNSLGVKFALKRPEPPTEHPGLPTAPDLDSVSDEKVTKAKTDPQFEEAVQFVMARHSYPRGAAESVVAEFGVSDILNDKKIWAIEEKFKDASGKPEATKTDGDSGAQPQ